MQIGDIAKIQVVSILSNGVRIVKIGKKLYRLEDV